MRHLACKTLMRALMLARVRKQDFANWVPVWQHRLDDPPEIIGQDWIGHRRFLQSTSSDEDSPIGLPKPLR